MAAIMITQEGDPEETREHYCPELAKAFFIPKGKLTQYAVFSLYLTEESFKKQESAIKFTFNETKLYDRVFRPMTASAPPSNLWANMVDVQYLEWASYDRMTLSGGFRLICHMDKNKIDTRCFDFFFV
uniref:Uncharacterized protein n=1 Tax=Marseillevirus LCMAC201 TaxID=2506605 RepID=A0A481YWS5_9VIRU|nr:MAG: hypothetical protein LCMAC201_05310 [Marseillevirus LCMAC201]